MGEPSKQKDREVWVISTGFLCLSGDLRKGVYLGYYEGSEVEMREKKVRAWDNATEGFLYSDKFPSMWQFYKELENRGIRHFETEDYTGLHDKNGKEIYEGDIVECQFYCYGLSPLTERITVEYMKYPFHKVAGFYPFYGKLNGYEVTPNKVIGNIHENPERVK